MDDQRVGAAVRALRIRREWTQRELATRCGVSASLVSLIERGHIDSLSLRALRRVAAELDARLVVTARTRAGDLERLLNAGHAALHEDVARHFNSIPAWRHSAEVSFSIYGERGVIDILAFHEPNRALLVVELKTALVSFEDLLATMDVRTRLAQRVARERDWHATSTSAWVIVADSRANRDRAAAHRALLGSAFPADGRRMRAWLRRPTGAIRALSFWSNSNTSGVTRNVATRHRVRHARGHDAARHNSHVGSSYAAYRGADPG